MKNIIVALSVLMCGDPHIALVLSNPMPGPAQGLPCTFGIPLPPGEAHSVKDLEVTRGYRPYPGVEWMPLARWRDGSLRWVQGRTCLDRIRGRSLGLLVRVRAATRPWSGREFKGISVQSEEEFHQVALSAGPGPGLSLLFKRRGGSHPQAASFGKTIWIQPGEGFRLIWLDEEGMEEEGRLLTTEPAILSPGCVQMVSEGQVGDSARFRLKSTFWAGSDLFDLEAVIEGWPPRCHAFAVSLPVAEDGLARIRFLSRDRGRIKMRKGKRIKLEVSTDRTSILEVDGKTVFEGDFPCLPLSLGGRKLWITLGIEDAGLQGRLRIQSKDGRIMILRNGLEEWPSGWRVRFRAAVACTPKPPRSGVVNAVLSMSGFGGGVLKRKSGALEKWGGLGPLPRSSIGEGAIDAVFRRTLALFLQELNRPEYRTSADLGDYRVEHLGWANGEFDVILALVRSYLWTRDAEVLRWARRSVHHHLDVDLDWRNTGLPWVHGPHHNGGVELGHTWLKGLLYYGLLNGDEEAVTAARGIAMGITSFLEGSKGGLRLEREYGWTLTALNCAAELFPGEGFEKYRDRIAGELVGYVHAKGLLCLEATRNPSVARTTTYVGLGVVVPALAAYGRATGKKNILHLARGMAKRYLVEAWDPETEQMAWSLYVNVSTGSVLHRKKKIRGGDLLFLAAGLASVADREAGAWFGQQAAGLRELGVRRFRQDGYGAHNGERVRVLHALFELAAILDG